MQVRARFPIVAILAVVAAATASVTATTYGHFSIKVSDAQSDLTAAFTAWAVHNNKHYAPGTPEFQKRLAAWTHNFERAAASGAESVTLNGLQDVTLQEFESSFFGTADRSQPLRAVTPAANKKAWIYDDVDEFPSAVDWREKGVVGPIKNQHANGTPCGCCWAFATIGIVECIYAMVEDKVLSLSEQQLIDCDRGPPWYNLGCEGGDFGGGVDYIVKNKGVDLEEDYPYEGFDDKCQWKKEKVRYGAMDGFIDVPRSNYTAFMQAVTKHPVATAVCCGPYLSYWHNYTGGIMDIEGHEEACYRPLDHAVTVVGYGEEDGKPYWLVKNSWGPRWGEEGFFRVPRIESSPHGWGGFHTAPGFPIKRGLNPEVDAYLDKEAALQVS